MGSPAELALKAKELRRAVLNTIYRTGKCHIGSCLSCADILTVLFEECDLTPELKETEDRIIAGKGWVAAAFFHLLAKKGIVPYSDLLNFCQPGEENYIGLLEPTVKGVWCATGSIGMGLPFGVGMAKAKKLKGLPGTVHVIEGDGGMQSGLTWEAIEIASALRLDNLKLWVDQNNLQATGKNVLGKPNLTRKLMAFGWETVEIDGHNHEHLLECLEITPTGRPTAVICRTTKGKGLSYCENKLWSHYLPPNKSQYEQSLKEL